MNLTSDRLLYTKIVECDLSNYLSWYTNEEVMRLVMGRAFTEEEALARFQKALKTNDEHPEIGWYSVSKKDDGSFLGIAKLVYAGDRLAEVGYGMMPPYWGKKYATEMLRCIVDHARTIPDIEELLAIVNPINMASKKVLTNQKFLLERSGYEDDRPVEYYGLRL